MIERKLKDLLNNTLGAIHHASTGNPGWNAIIALYENAIAAANCNKYFSVEDAPRIYLEFSSDYSTNVFKLMDQTATETDRFFKELLGTYIAGKVGAKGLDGKIKELSRYPDVFEEFINYILDGEIFSEHKGLVVEGYTAKRLTDETILTPLGAFNYLIYLKEEPKEALADLKAKLPRRTMFDSDKLKEVQPAVDEKTTTQVEESTQPQQPTPEVGIPQKELLEKLDALQQAVAGLQQTFDDKIAEDAHKNGLFDNMHRELTKFQNGAMDKIVDTMALDIIQLVDTTKGHIRVYEKKEPTEDNYKRLLRIVKGIAEDLQDILYRQNIESYRVEGHQVDVRRQKIIQTMPTDDQSKDNLVAVRAADGYEKDGKVLRPERIKIFKYSPDATESTDK